MSATSKSKSRARDNAGVIATIINQNTGELDTLHFHGYVKDALALVVAEIDGREPGWKVRSISTPRTIMRDLKGTRHRRSEFSNARSKRPGMAGRASDDPRDAEITLLHQIGRIDLLSPVVHAHLHDVVSSGRHDDRLQRADRGPVGMNSRTVA